jgi:hypothetical protein
MTDEVIRALTNGGRHIRIKVLTSSNGHFGKEAIAIKAKFDRSDNDYKLLYTVDGDPMPRWLHNRTDFEILGLID